MDWFFPQDVVVFILNTASPWIIPERLTAPQHTRFILPPFHPTKSIAALRGRYFSFMGTVPWKFHEPTERDTGFSVNAAAQTGAGTSFGVNGDPHTWAAELSTYFCVLTIRQQLPRNGFERSGGGQEPSRGHKFSILENLEFHWDFTSQTLASFQSDLVGACLPQTLLMVRTWRCEQQRRVVLT